MTEVWQSWYLFAVVLITLIGGVTGPASAQSPPVREQFATGDLPPSWTFTGEPTIRDGALRLQSGDQARPPGMWNTFELDIRVLLRSGTITIGFGHEQGISGSVTIDSDVMYLGVPGNRFPKALFEASGTWRSVRLRVEKNVVVVFGNGEELHRVNDIAVGRGPIVFRAQDDSAAFVDDVRIVSLEVARPQLIKLAPAEAVQGSEQTAWVVGKDLQENSTVAFAGRGIQVTSKKLHSSELLEMQLTIDPDASVGSRDLVVRSGQSRSRPAVTLNDALRVIPRPALPPRIHSIEPSTFDVGQVLVVQVTGEQLAGISDVRVFPESHGIVIRSVESMSASTARVQLEIDSNAVFGRHELIPHGADPDIRQGQFSVLTAAAQPAQSGIVPFVLGGLGVVVFLVGSYIAGFITGRITDVPWPRFAKHLWERAAETDLPNPRQVCTWTCKAEAGVKINDWEVTSLLVESVLPDRKDPQEQRSLSGSTLQALNDLGRFKELLKGDEGAEQEIRPLVDAVLGIVASWRDAGRSPATIRLTVALKKPMATRFSLLHCEQVDGQTTWIEKRSWSRTVKAGEPEVLGLIQGPHANERDFSGRAGTEISELLVSLIRRVQLLA